MSKEAKLKEWIEQSSSLEGCIYISVDKHGNSYSQIHSTEVIVDKFLIDVSKRLLNNWDEQLRHNSFTTKDTKLSKIDAIKYLMDYSHATIDFEKGIIYNAIQMIMWGDDGDFTINDMSNVIESTIKD